MDINKVVASRLKSLRKEKKLTQTDMAKLLNVTQNAIFRYESGQNQPSLSTLLFYSEYFNVSIDYIFGRERKISSAQINKRAYEKENIKEFINYCFTPGTEVFELIKNYTKDLVNKGLDNL